MHLATLVTNTDKSSFAEQHPKDGQKFTDLIHLVRPDWEVTGFEVHEGQFPDDITSFDGAMITGSPASCRSDLHWVKTLLDLIRQMDQIKLPVFGACFGHQAIALALGGEIARNPLGWVHGLVPNQMVASVEWADDLPKEIRLYGSHCEHVARLPERAEETAISSGLNAGFRIADHIWTSQHHPEMSHAFITALTNEMRADLGPAAYSSACESLGQQSDQLLFAESLARFFELQR